MRMSFLERSVAFCPGHVTGFFSIHDEEEDLLKKGSLGAGFSINHGVKSWVSEFKPVESGKMGVKIFSGGRLFRAETSKTAALEVLKEVGVGARVVISQEMMIPPGYGFGTSAAGALSAAFALNDFLGDPLSRVEVFQLAHKAEIVNGTGLGDVIGVSVGGFEIRLEPGAPEVGGILNFSVSERDVVCVYVSKISKKVLSNPLKKRKINDACEPLIGKLLENLSLENFCNFSRMFAEKSGLLPKPIRVLLLHALEHGYLNCSQVMLGGSAFFFVDDVEEFIRDMDIDREKTFVTRVDFKSVRILGQEG